jgi:hypothetical protein
MRKRAPVGIAGKSFRPLHVQTARLLVRSTSAAIEWVAEPATSLDQSPISLIHDMERVYAGRPASLADQDPFPLKGSG